MHIKGNPDTSSGGIDHRQSSLQRGMPMTSIIRPHSCWPMDSRQAPLSSTPFQAATTNPLHHPATLLSPFLPSSLSPSVHPLYIYPILCPFLSRRLPPLFPCISVPSSFPPVIRSRWPPAGVNGGENQPKVSGCISSLRCSLASNEDGHCQNHISRCARHTWGHNELYVWKETVKLLFCSTTCYGILYAATAPDASLPLPVYPHCTMISMIWLNAGWSVHFHCEHMRSSGIY